MAQFSNLSLQKLNRAVIKLALNCLTIMTVATILICRGTAEWCPDGSTWCVNGSCVLNNDTSTARTAKAERLKDTEIADASDNNNLATQKYRCECAERWSGPSCEIYSCSGRTLLTESSGQISDGTGNYTTDNRCTWLISGTQLGVPLRLNFSEFATECSWDHLYIFDGDSAWSPRIAAMSGLVKSLGDADSQMSELVASSGKAYVHFYSDAAYYMSGFILNFWQSHCSAECSLHGRCLTGGKCNCSQGWIGPSCSISLCPSNCSAPSNGQCQPNGCVCKPGYHGDDCSKPMNESSWKRLPDMPSNGATSMGVAVIGDDMWALLGYRFDDAAFSITSGTGTNSGAGNKTSRKSAEMLVQRYSFSGNKWYSVTTGGGMGGVVPTARYAHSVAVKGTEIYMYGGLVNGRVVNELWKLDTIHNSWGLVNSTWESVNQSNNSSSEGAGTQMFPLACAGHTAHIVDGQMYVLFGHSPALGYLNQVQQFDIDTGLWSIVESSGALLRGSYGHSSVYDVETNRIIVHGGYTMGGGVAVSSLLDTVYSLNLTSMSWTVLRSSGVYRYLHSAVLLDRLMIVYAGNTHNDTSSSQGAKCYASDLLAYDIDCDRWERLSQPIINKPWSPTQRYGHSAVTHSGRMFIAGGFNGLVLNDLYEYTPGICTFRETPEDCLKSPLAEGSKCVWLNDTTPSCINATEALLLGHKAACEAEITKYASLPLQTRDQRCAGASNRLDQCPSCVVNSAQCYWCESIGCAANCSRDSKYAVRDEDSCYIKDPAHSSSCAMADTCQSCIIDSACAWNARARKCATMLEGEQVQQQQQQPSRLTRQCDIPTCDVHTSCSNCTNQYCMWCANENRCVESSAYVISFPYGQCVEWTTRPEKCEESSCRDLKTCSSCQQNLLCGWCNDPSNTGLGHCLDGNLTGPVAGKQCTKAEPWYFTKCPPCQCNGHSTCPPNSSHCQSCKDHTTGAHCESCEKGYFGRPIAGANCSECMCNNQAEYCNTESGVCYCHTRGVIGDNCDQCDKAHKYYGDPTVSGGTCYYEMAIDFIFTFNLSNEENKSHTHINFMNTPPSPDKDVDFSINCSSEALMNITVKSAGDLNETVLYSNQRCQLFITKFPAAQFRFGPEYNTTFYVYIYNFHTPLILEMYFSQTDHLDLFKFFLTFFCCFFTLLFLAFVAWKVKQRYDLFRRSQRRMQEMAEMASRPFAALLVDVDSSSCATNINFVERSLPGSTTTSTMLRSSRQRLKRPDCKVSPIALEPITNHKAAVLSVIVLLPRGDEDFTLPDQCGIAIGSALVTLSGHTRRSSTDQSLSKAERSSKRRKQLAVTAPAPTSAPVAAAAPQVLLATGRNTAVPPPSVV